MCKYKNLFIDSHHCNAQLFSNITGKNHILNLLPILNLEFHDIESPKYKNQFQQLTQSRLLGERVHKNRMENEWSQQTLGARSLTLEPTERARTAPRLTV